MCYHMRYTYSIAIYSTYTLVFVLIHDLLQNNIQCQVYLVDEFHQVWVLAPKASVCVKFAGSL